jgi:AbrB family looped-hinge helix DNA binding protein
MADLARGLRQTQCGTLFVGKHRKNESLTRETRSITLLIIGITESELATNVTVKGQVTLPKAVREAANIRPGDRVNVRVRPEGGVIIEAEAAAKSAEAYINGLKDMSRRRPFRGFSTEEIMRMTRGDD